VTIEQNGNIEPCFHFICSNCYWRRRYLSFSSVVI